VAGRPVSEPWRDHFDDLPPSFHRLLADLMVEAQAVPGRRAARKVNPDGESMQDIVNVVYPRRSVKPFGEALKDATKYSQGAVAHLAGMNRGNLARMVAGQEPFTKDKIERIARAIRVDPAYFHEYRVLAIHEMIDAVLSPEQSLRLFGPTEPDHREQPRPKGLNAPDGFRLVGKSAVANAATRRRAASA